eukprot:361335-Chlamydomonas_euryale.AAC.2
MSTSMHTRPEPLAGIPPAPRFTPHTTHPAYLQATSLYWRAPPASATSPNRACNVERLPTPHLSRSPS